MADTRTDRGLRQLVRLEDWWACWLGFLILGVALLGWTGKVPKIQRWGDDPRDAFRTVSASIPVDFTKEEAEAVLKLLAGRKETAGKYVAYDPTARTLTLKGVMTEAQRDEYRHLSDLPVWQQAVDRLYEAPRQTSDPIALPLVVLMVVLAVPLAGAILAMGGRIRPFLTGYPVVFVLAVAATVISEQAAVDAWGLSYALWALVLGLVVANTVGTPAWLSQGARTEFYIKTGLVLLGAEVVFTKILALGAPGLFVAWCVTPVVIIFMWYFGTRWLKMTNKPLVIVISAATSVCGVSAAIATAAACRATKEDLTLTVGLSLIFTVAMMVLMPMGVQALGIDPIVGAAWMGGTIDSTGAVVAAGAMLGPEAERVAAVVKMIQNVLIGLVAFVVALLWVSHVDRASGSDRPGVGEIWRRFPKFVLGFVATSLLVSFVIIPLAGAGAENPVAAGEQWVSKHVTGPVTSNLRHWLFCMAFVSIGLESNFKDLIRQMAGGKPLWLYIVGQSFNLVLTLIAAYLAFGGILFDLG